MFEAKRAISSPQITFKCKITLIQIRLLSSKGHFHAQQKKIRLTSVTPEEKEEFLPRSMFIIHLFLLNPNYPSPTTLTKSADVRRPSSASWASEAGHILHRLPYSWCEDTSHRRHPNTSYTSHLSSAVTKQHDGIKAEGREAPAREHVWVEEKDAWKWKNAGREERCAWLCTSSSIVPLPTKKTQQSTSFLPSCRRIHRVCVWEKTIKALEAKFSSCWSGAIFTSSASQTLTIPAMTLPSWLRLFNNLPPRRWSMNKLLKSACMRLVRAGLQDEIPAAADNVENDSWKQTMIRCSVI